MRDRLGDKARWYEIGPILSNTSKRPTKHDSGWKVEDWDQVNPELHLDLDWFLEEDRRIHGDS